MKNNLLFITILLLTFKIQAQDVGIGETNPEAKLHLKTNSGLSYPQLKITEDQLDYSRIKMNNTVHPDRYWDIAGLCNTAVNGSKLNFFHHNGTIGRDLMSLNANGNLGIGTTNPSERVDIVGNIRIRNLSGTGDRNLVVDQNGRVKTGTIGAGDTDWLENSTTVSSGKRVFMYGPAFDGNNNSTMVLSNVTTGPAPLYLTLGPVSYYDANELNTYNMIGASQGAHQLNIQNQSAGNLSLVEGGGRVGIGSVSSNAKLNIVGTDNNGVDATLRVETAGNGQVLLFDGNEIDVTGNVNTLALNSNSGHPVSIGSHHVPSGFKFSVNGKMIAEELMVQLKSNWPDYVFKEDYALRSIPALEKEIQKLGHLPGLPSAEEVESNGQEVGMMQVKLVEKVEELTLYIIQLQKEIDSLKTKLIENEK